MVKPIIALALMSTVAAAAPSANTFDLNFTIHDDAKVSRHTSIRIADNTCGSMRMWVDGNSDEIRVCLDEPNGGNARMRIEWKVKSKKTEIAQESTMVVARGANLTLDGGALKLDVEVK